MSAVQCDICNISFTAKKNYYRHIRNFHPDDKINYENSNIVCPRCDEKSSSIQKLQDHITKAHGVKLAFQNLTFHSEEDFLTWKSKTEEDTPSRFSKYSGEKDCEDGKKSYYYCHRSGFFKGKEKRQRNMKQSGSIKIGKSCPASIVVVKREQEEITELNVCYQSLHIGHETNAEHNKLFLSTQDKTLLAAKLSLGIPKKKILKDIATSYDPCKRIKLTTNQDLENIKRDFNIEDDVVLHSDDATSVKMHVDKLKEDDPNCILIFKPVGEVCSLSGVDSTHFLLGYMNSAQAKVLELYGNNVLCIDATHGMNKYGIQLTTLLVIDSHYEGFPVAFLYSSKTNKEAFVAFFQKIHERVPNLTPRYFMSDDYPAFFNAFQDVYNSSASFLLCTWHVLRAWNQALSSKIRDSSVREAVKARLLSIHTETDQITFEKSSSDFVQNLLSTENTRDFGDYFLKNYMTRPRQWAFCYRLNAGINTNMKIERWHSAIKHGEADGKVIKRLDKSLCILLNALETKFINRVIALEKGKSTTKIKEINNRHKSSKELDPNNIIMMEDNKKWIVPSAQTNSTYLETYEVNREQTCACALRCNECNICIHEFTCTCPDYAIRYVICKHIHLVCMQYKQDFIGDNLIIDDNVNIIEKEILESHLTVSKDKDIEKKKKEAITLLSNMLEKCKSESISYEELDVIVSSVKDTNKKLTYIENSNIISENCVKDCKRKIEKQKRFSKK